MRRENTFLAVNIVQTANYKMLVTKEISASSTTSLSRLLWHSLIVVRD